MKNLNTFKLLSDYESEKSGVLNTPNVSFVAEDNSIRYLLEYEWVDLGLPSGLKWATCNVGADSPEDAGLYFAWGETVGYTSAQVTTGERVFDQAIYQAGAAASISVDLTLEQDAARANLGGNWRMPTRAEFKELINSSYTTQTWTDNYNGTGVKGRVITSKSNGNSIFLPAAGSIVGSSADGVGLKSKYWSSSCGSSSSAYTLFFNSGSIYTGYSDRYCGMSVRGVCE